MQQLQRKEEFNLEKQKIYYQLTMDNQADLFEFLSTELRQQGIVGEQFLQALKDREDEFPTGLPLPIGVAIPHTDGADVKEDCLVFASLSKPIVFHEMGGEKEDIVQVKIVILLAITEGKKHLKTLQNLITSIQQAGFIESLDQAKSAEEMAAIITNYL